MSSRSADGSSARLVHVEEPADEPTALRTNHPFVTSTCPLTENLPVSAARQSFEIKRVRDGLRLSQHGVVLSELRTSAGPTHSVFDVLAAIIAVLAPQGRVGVLGFAGGSLMAPLRALGFAGPVAAVDLDRAGYDLFRQHCAGWAGDLTWTKADAAEWLRAQPTDFGLLLDDLSIPDAGDVIKPAITWDVLPELVRSRLRPGGFGVFNLLMPPSGQLLPELKRIGGLFGRACVVNLTDFENRILIGGLELPESRVIGRSLRQALDRLDSRQAGRIRLSGVG